MLRNIYIVDDDEPVRTSLRTLLSTRAEMLIRAYPTGDDFIAEAGQLEAGVVLLDIHMPGTSGMDVLRKIGEAALRMVPVIITGQGNIGLAVQAMKGGALDFLEKPYDHVTLLDTVDRGFARLEEASATTGREAAARARIDALSPREVDVLMGLIAGRANKTIAYELEISPRTVEIYRANLMAKLGVRSLSEALRIAFAAGLLENV